MSEDIFEQATRLKIRFSTPQGQISVEDLWDLPLTSQRPPNLDSIAIGLYKTLGENSEVNFVEARNTANDIEQLKFDVVKHVIAIKLKERKDKENEKQKQAKRELIMEIIENKQTEDLRGKSTEDLKKMLDEL